MEAGEERKERPDCGCRDCPVVFNGLDSRGVLEGWAEGLVGRGRVGRGTWDDAGLSLEPRTSDRPEGGANGR